MVFSLALFHIYALAKASTTEILNNNEYFFPGRDRPKTQNGTFCSPRSKLAHNLSLPNRKSVKVNI